MLQSQIEVLNLKNCQTALRPRPKDAHKGLFGHVLVIGGNYGMAGAVLMAGTAALRSGAGLVTVATRPEHATHLFTAVPVLMTLSLNKPEDLDPLLHRATIILLGPGLGVQDWGRDLFQYLLQPKFEDHRMVIDADALNLLSSLTLHSRSNWVLTPHPGEAARLLGCTTDSIQKDRLKSLAALQKKYQGTIVLKGAGTLVMGESGIPKLCQQGNPGMATAGMGDVLSGIIAGLYAQSLSAEAAASLAVVAHATAGDYASKGHLERGILASDLIEYIPQCLNP